MGKKKNFLRSDLALELCDIFDAAKNVPKKKTSEEREDLYNKYGIKRRRKRRGEVLITSITIEKAEGAKKLGKPKGRYVTVEFPPLSDNERGMEEKALLVGEEIIRLIPSRGSVLVVGLGNQSVTPDSLGPRAISKVLATRHIKEEFARTAELDDLRSTAVFAPGVLGQTGVESSEMVKGVCDTIKPQAVIVIDALAAQSLDRLGSTIQLCDTGISPGSGVGNNRRPLNQKTLGVPVIGVGVPTVVDAQTLFYDLAYANTSLKKASKTKREVFAGENMMVTPREIDLIISRAANLVAMSINSALQPGYSPLALAMTAE